jgi:Bacterial SH3 domain
MVQCSRQPQRMCCESANWIRYIFIAAILYGAALFPAPANAQDNPLSNRENLARQLALRILDDLSPLEAWVDSSETSKPPKKTETQAVEIVGSSVNIRSGPTTDAAVFSVAQPGDQFKLISTSSDWFTIQLTDGQDGHVSTRFARIVYSQAPGADSKPVLQTISPAYLDQAKSVLSATKDAIAKMEFLASASEASFSETYGESAADTDDAVRRATEKSLYRIRKYYRVVSEKHNRYTVMAGGDVPSGEAVPYWKEKLRGTVRIGLGVNNAESEVVGTSKTKTDVTRSEFVAELMTDLTPRDELGLSVGRIEEIAYVPATRTFGALNYKRKISPTTRIGSDVRFSKYENDINNLSDANQTEFTLSGAASPTKALQVNASFSLLGNKFPNNDTLDYKDTRFGVGAAGQANESVTWGLSYATTEHDVDLSTSADDNKQNRIEGKLKFKTGGRSFVSLVGYTGGYDFGDTSDTRSYTRSGVKITKRGSSEAGRSQSMSLEFRKKSHDSANGRDYTEFRGSMRKSQIGIGTQTSRTSVSANYRNYDDDGNISALDYLEARFDSEKATSPGMFFASSGYGQYYFKSDDAERNALLNIYGWLGLETGNDAVFRIGPHLAANTELVMVDADTLGTFEGPYNTVRFGLKGTVQANVQPLRVRGSFRYEKLKYYNIDNSSSPTRMELEGEGVYRINSQYDASAKLKYYKTGSDDVGTVRSSEFDILFSVTYRLGGG